jgi:hypothetical protein
VRRKLLDAIVLQLVCLLWYDRRSTSVYYSTDSGYLLSMGIDRVMFRFASPPTLATWEIWRIHGKRTWKCSPNRNEESLHSNGNVETPEYSQRTDVGLSVMR